MELIAQGLHGEDVQQHVQRVQHVAEHGRPESKPALAGEAAHGSNNNTFLVSRFSLGTIERSRSDRYRYYVLATGEQHYEILTGFQDFLVRCGAIHF